MPYVSLKALYPTTWKIASQYKYRRLLVCCLISIVLPALDRNEAAAQHKGIDQSSLVERGFEAVRSPVLGMPIPGGWPQMGAAAPPPPPSKPIESLVPAPDWMKIGLEKEAAYSRLRTLLRTKVETDFQNVPLRTLLKNYAMQTGVDIFLNLTELDLLGMDPETPITVHHTDVSAEVALNLILDPLELTMRFTEAGVEITSQDAAESDPQIRYYDAAWVIAETGHLDSLMNVIQISIDPDSWLSSGGTSSIVPLGQVLVVAAPPTTQIKIEDMLSNLAMFRPKPTAKTALPLGDTAAELSMGKASAGTAVTEGVERTVAVSENGSPTDGNQ